MLPSLLSREIEAGLKSYLRTAYEPSDPFFRGLMDRFLERDGAWMKGPYVQIGLPFRRGEKDCDFFEGFRTDHRGYTHQEAAWERLKAAGCAANTLVATGTGSGKTECFLYPILEQCAREGASDGPRGIRALIIYPMNALAADQARRIADLIHRIPAFKGLRAGLFVGGATAAGGGTVMTPTTVITDRETLRERPPDILLTNYKMLDYLLIRPRDRELWAQNGPETLRTIVVDELHTFDGAQGTDLALLLRRLKARLKAPDGAIAHIGTSATLGGSPDTGPLREYARQVFGSPFPPGCVITESRLDVREFLGDQPPQFLLEARPDLGKALDPAEYPTPDEAVRGWFGVFFPGEPAPADVEDAVWRQELGSLLKRHSLFVGLLKAVQTGAPSLDELRASLANHVAASVRPHLSAALDALLALAGRARSPENADLPLVTLRIQVWLRELRRMVAPVTANRAEVELRAFSELAGKPDRLYLPLIQCAECHTTAWLSRLTSPGEGQLSTALEDIYNSWFAGAVETARLYPLLDRGGAQTEGVSQFVCAECGALNSRDQACIVCGGEELAPVFRPTGQKKVVRGAKTAVYHDGACPVCGAANSLFLIGSRSTTLGAQIVERSWGSLYNDDRKMIAFSDSVQDAAHRAGFISARTYIHTVRKALAQGIEYLAPGPMAWSEFRPRFEQLWRDANSPLFMDAARLVSEFIGPNMTWQRGWTDLYRTDGPLAPNSPLIGRVERRLGWQALSEFTYAGNRGRNLERVGVATLAPRLEEMNTAAALAEKTLSEQFGMNVSRETVFWWLWGLVIQMRRRGAVRDPAMGSYAEDGNLWKLTKHGGRAEWMPRMGPRSPRPVFLSLGPHKEFDCIVNGRRRTWYDEWMAATLAHDSVLLPSDRAGLYRAGLGALEAVGIVKTSVERNVMIAGLNPERLFLFTDVRRLQTESGARALMAPAETAVQLIDMPCLDAPEERYTSVRKPAPAAAHRLRTSALRRVITAEHTGLLEREERESLENRFKSRQPQPWYENLLSATPTLEMGVDIGDLSTVMLCSVPPTVASFLQRVGRAGRRDGNAYAATLADGASPHDLYFFEEPSEMMAGEVGPPGVFLKAPEVLRRQFCAFCLDDWVATGIDEDLFPAKTVRALDAIDTHDPARFPYPFIEHLQKHHPRLVEAFLDLLEENVDPEVSARLLAFVEGTEEVTPLRIRLLEALTEIAEERKKYTARVKELRRRIKPLKAKPGDEATTAEITGLEQEQGKYQELTAEINGRELLNTLTDAGLIPNYAFPEAGIELKSVLWRRSTPEDKTSSKYVSLRALRYERPASSALSEFAPENRFYANQRRVEVDQINMDLARLETWRLCPNCHHMQNLEMGGEVSPVCPRCEDAMWGDSAQKRQLLRFRQAVANSDDTNVRIDDSAEEREPRFYVRQLLVDFTPADIREAWMLKSEALPFGFEFIASAAFRDINFGESGKTGVKFKVADHDLNRPGFRLCRRCGKVQTAPRTMEPDAPDAQEHTFDCVERTNPDPENILECLYLYREFHSEALRILVPFTRLGVDNSVVQSFSAALQLGLKRRFGGQVDHLRVVIQETPDPDGGPRRCYVMLYDSVPGGTGYLHQLLAHDAATLKQVFQKALEALEGCPCQDDPSKDGCYRCVYQYRLGRSMGLVSRRIALSVMRELVGKLDQLERTETISGIGLNHALESVLERRFIESLSRLSQIGGLPHITLVQEIVNGAQGYHLQVGDNRYTIELQVDLGHDDGVRIASRPDFLIRPLSSASKRKPIAVFCDGWTFHQDKLKDDAAKRTAIANSGRFRVWSVVMDDVEAALQCKAESTLPSPYQAKANRPGAAAPAGFPRPEAAAFTRNAVAELLHWLARPCSGHDPGMENAWAASMVWLMGLVPRDAEAFARVQTANRELRNRLPVWLPDAPPQSVDAALTGERLFNIHGVYPMQVHAAAQREEPVPNIVWFDDVGSGHDSERHEEWRWWLRAFNWLQAIPGAVLVTESGVDAGDYAALVPASATAIGTTGGAAPESGAAWEEALGQMMAALVGEAKKLAAAGGAAPDEAGYSLVSAEGEEISMAELVWSNEKVAVLTAEYVGDRERWEAEGWEVVVTEPLWGERVLDALARRGGVSA